MEDDVLVLDDSNFDEAIGSFDTLLVEFYAPVRVLQCTRTAQFLAKPQVPLHCCGLLESVWNPPHVWLTSGPAALCVPGCCSRRRRRGCGPRVLHRRRHANTNPVEPCLHAFPATLPPTVVRTLQVPGP